MSDRVPVTPRAHRAKWAQEITPYDSDGNMHATTEPVKPRRRLVEVHIEIDDTTDAIDRVCRVLSDGRTKIVKVVE